MVDDRDAEATQRNQARTENKLKGRYLRILRELVRLQVAVAQQQQQPSSSVGIAAAATTAATISPLTTSSLAASSSGSHVNNDDSDITRPVLSLRRTHAALLRLRDSVKRIDADIEHDPEQSTLDDSTSSNGNGNNNHDHEEPYPSMISSPSASVTRASAIPSSGTEMKVTAIVGARPLPTAAATAASTPLANNSMDNDVLARLIEDRITAATAPLLRTHEQIQQMMIRLETLLRQQASSST